MKLLHYTKDDYEGMACAILSKYIYGDNVDIYFCSKGRQSIINHSFSTNYNNIFSTGFNNVEDNLAMFMSGQKNAFLEYLKKLRSMFPENFNNNTALDTFIEHSIAYIDWSWNNKGLYLGKNIDELSKLYDKESIIQSVANRIVNKEHIVTDEEKEILKFEKYRMNQYIDSKKINKGTTCAGYNYGIVYADAYTTEIANMLLKKHNVDIALVIDMSEKVAIYKYNKNNKKMIGFNKKLENIGAIISNSGGIVKFEATFDSSINTALIGSLE